MEDESVRLDGPTNDSNVPPNNVEVEGTKAWQRLKSSKNWDDWVKVGKALEVGRQFAMNKANTNQPEGKAYIQVFGEWLKQHQLDDTDKGDRSHLFKVMENLQSIEDWRGTLPLSKQLKLNHPRAILRNWKDSTTPEKKKSSKPSVRKELADKKRENADLQAHNDELEAARKTDEPILETVRHLVDRARDGSLGRWIKDIKNSNVPLGFDSHGLSALANQLDQLRAAMRQPDAKKRPLKA